MVSDRIVVVDNGRECGFSFEDMLAYHGGGFPGGAAHAFKVLVRSLPLLAPDSIPERRSITIETAFGGPGARDAFELVTRAVTEQRLILDPDMARSELGLARERFVFRLRYSERAVTVVLRPAFVTDEFISLARRSERTPHDERRLDTMKAEMAGRVMAARADEVYEVELLVVP